MESLEMEKLITSYFSMSEALNKEKFGLHYDRFWKPGCQAFQKIQRCQES